MNELRINGNDQVKVKLTPYGLMVMEANLLALSAGTPVKMEFKPPEVDEEGYSTHTLWVLMNEFGQVMYSGNPQCCFVDNEIKVGRPNA